MSETCLTFVTEIIFLSARRWWITDRWRKRFWTRWEFSSSRFFVATLTTPKDLSAPKSRIYCRENYSQLSTFFISLSTPTLLKNIWKYLKKKEKEYSKNILKYPMPSQHLNLYLKIPSSLPKKRISSFRSFPQWKMSKDTKTSHNNQKIYKSSKSLNKNLSAVTYVGQFFIGPKSDRCLALSVPESICH